MGSEVGPAESLTSQGTDLGSRSRGRSPGGLRLLCLLRTSRRVAAEPAPAAPPAPGTSPHDDVLGGTHAMTELAFAPLVNSTREALAAAPPAAALATFRVESRQTAGLRSDVRIRQFEVGVDEPPTLGGEDTAPNPVEY